MTVDIREQLLEKVEEDEIFAKEEVKNAALEDLRLNLTTLFPLDSIDSIFLIQGEYIGTISAFIGASNENITSSTVTGFPSCQLIPERKVTSIVCSSIQLNDSAAQG